MPGKYQTLRTFKTARFTVTLAAIVDEDSFTYDGDDEDGSTQAAIDSGELTPWTFRVRVCLDGREIASDYLGASYYADPADFMDHRECGRYTRELRAKGDDAVCGSYFADMVSEAISEARKALRALQSVHVRG